MPVRPLKPCAWPGCNMLVRGESYCPRHALVAAERQQAAKRTVHLRYNERRDASDAFYKTERWKRLSAYYRKKHPVCEHCANAASDITDHIKPVKTHPDLSLAWDNLRALCRPCHNSIGERIGLISGSGSSVAEREGGSKV